MKYKASIDVMPHKELLEPQGKTVANNLDHIDIMGVQTVRIGKHIEMILEAETTEAAEALVDTACKKLLANVLMEKYTFEAESFNEN